MAETPYMLQALGTTSQFSCVWSDPGLTRVTDGFLGLSRLFNIPTRSLRSSAKGRASATSRSSRCITEGCCGTGPGPPTLLESYPRVSGSPRPKRLWYVPGLGSAGWAVPVSALGSVKSFVDAQVRAAPVSKGSCLKLRVSSRLWLTGGQTSLSRPWAQPSGSVCALILPAQTPRWWWCGCTCQA